MQYSFLRKLDASSNAERSRATLTSFIRNGDDCAYRRAYTTSKSILRGKIFRPDQPGGNTGRLEEVLVRGGVPVREESQLHKPTGHGLNYLTSAGYVSAMSHD